MGCGLRRRQGAGAAEYRRRQVSQSENRSRSIEQNDLPTHELGADKPGRTFSPTGHGSRSSRRRRPIGTTRRSRHSSRTLVKQLDAALAAGKAKSIIVVAPPRALGMIRPAYSHALRAAVRAEVHKDLVKLPIHEIEKHLTAA